jgi:hypothetical protein
MVDTRLRGEWLHNPRFDDLSDTAWRLFTLAMIWSNEQGTDGRVPTRYLSMLHPDLDSSSVLPELEAAGVVDLEPDAIQFRDWGGDLGQSTAEEVQERREKARARQRAFRERQAVREPRDTSYVTRDVGQAQEEAKASSPSAYATRDVTRDEKCPKHPVDNGEPCGTCMRIRQERDARRPAAGGEARAIAERCRREGHLLSPGDLYCNRCGQKRDPNAWMEPREPVAVEGKL